jgi:di/tricarboxylate transporter
MDHHRNRTLDDILMVFAGSVVLGTAIQKTGIAQQLATGILDVNIIYPLTPLNP